jgi:hypothetical protein
MLPSDVLKDLYEIARHREYTPEGVLDISRRLSLDEIREICPSIKTGEPPAKTYMLAMIKGRNAVSIQRVLGAVHAAYNHSYIDVDQYMILLDMCVKCGVMVKREEEAVHEPTTTE